MENMLIKKSVDINASQEKVWSVLTTDEYTRQWFAEFGEGNFAITDWKEGSKAIFIDDTKSGLAGVVASNIPGQELIVQYNGVVTDGLEDYDSELAQSVKGYKECYWLTKIDSGSRLDIECDMGSEFFDYMSGAWDKALVRIKALSEND
ncbi:SRPBCC family protein [Dyadobacter arcticus]|uniref:Activator of Hsp90 ATPase homologue 1/2-like C-terminal domain-containing protein n=1 Tax=Dyadobacter arcticus TaxID=1078754 RepID=A0ABX0ULV9_9BACT|nr:SRPBCC domain-containing protein [Dyadobacter arcticus]NIJ53892.1 hypothetical protein [Dyadobacter arcticus]